ncbi:EamA family transporter [uncultured Vibrio sp.]|uniref:DMT family transporter n=1 Tax=uncultured Vibrio sp. TaxID=114054 RepID=UPI0029C8C6CA|nr:EamA family transporter [uncultured Vibrio sp.]
MSVALQSSSQYQSGAFSILFASVLWGTTGTAASFADQVSPLAIGAFAMGVGGVIQALLSLRSIVNSVSQLKRFKYPLAVGGTALAVYPLAFYTSMQLSGVAIGTVVSIASAPFFTILLERLISKAYSVSFQWWMSFALGVLGIVLLVLGREDGNTSASDSGYILGILLGLLAGLSYAVYSWVAKSMIDSGVKSQAALGCIFAGGALMLIPSLWFTGDNLFSGITNSMVAVYMAVVPMCIAYLAYGYGLRHVEVSRATLLTLFEPVVAAVFAVWIVGEQISVLGWLGIGFIGVCLILQTMESRTR